MVQSRGLHREAYAAWQRAWGQYGKLAPRALAAWRMAEIWTQRHLPAIYGSLRSEALGLQSWELSRPCSPFAMPL
jgi:hypothetical protein